MTLSDALTTAGLRAQLLRTQLSLADCKALAAEIGAQIVAAEAQAAPYIAAAERKRAAYLKHMSAPSGPAPPTVPQSLPKATPAAQQEGKSR